MSVLDYRDKSTIATEIAARVEGESEFLRKRISVKDEQINRPASLATLPGFAWSWASPRFWS